MNIELELSKRIAIEMDIYDSSAEAAVDHLKMARAHLNKEFNGHNVAGLMAGIDTLLYNLGGYDIDVKQQMLDIVQVPKEYHGKEK